MKRESNTEPHNQDDWLLRNKEAINDRLKESFAQAARGELYTEKELRRLLRKDRSQRTYK